MSKEIPAHIFLKLATLKHINPQCVVHELYVGPGAVLRVVGDPDNGGYEWVIESGGSELEFSDRGYGQSAVALRDGLIAWLGLPDGSVSFAPKAAPGCDALCNDARTRIDEPTTRAAENCDMKEKILRSAVANSSRVPSVLACMPKNIEELDGAIGPLFHTPRLVVFGFESLFVALSGARQSEAEIMRWDAEPQRPGWVSSDGQLLYVRGGLSGLPVHADLAELLCAMKYWRARNHPESPWIFPSPVDPSRHIRGHGLSRALHRLPLVGGYPRLSVQGLRAYYVSTRCSQGASCEIIGKELGLDLPTQYLERMYAPFAGSKGFTFTSQKPPWLALLGFKADSNTASFLGCQRARLIDQVYGIM